MNIKAMRNIHLYLGVFFAPLLLFFLISGCWQTFDLHEASKDGSYQPSAIIKSLSLIHTDQRLGDGKTDKPSSEPFKWLIVFMVAGLLATTILGIIMAFKYARGWIVWACLFLGVAVPFIFLTK